MLEVGILDSLAKLCRRADAPNDYFLLESFMSAETTPLDTDKLFRGPARVSLQAARGEAESFQMLLRADSKQAEKVSIEVGGLDGQAGGIAAENITYNPVGFIKSKPFDRFDEMTKRGLNDYAADPLMPADEMSVTPDDLLPVWVTVSVPRDAADGAYSGNLLVTAGDTDPVEVKIDLQVWNITLPEACPLWVSPTGDLPLAMETAGFDPTDAEQVEAYCRSHARLLKKYYIHGTLLRIHWWTGSQKPDGSWELDFSLLDRAIDAMREEGVFRFAAFFGYEGKKSDFFPGVKGLPWSEFYQLFADHMRERGLMPKEGWSDNFIFQIGPDEPGINQPGIGEGKVEAGFDPNHPILKEAIQHQVWAEEARLQPHGGCLATLFEPGDPKFNWELLGDHYQLIKFNDYRELDTEFANRQRSKGASLWWYTCCWPQSPNFLLTNSLVEARLIPWVAWKARVTGITFYGYDLWQRHKEPWSFLYPSKEEGHFGDHLKVYPNPRKDINEPIFGSVRMEAYRDGLEDYAYLWMLDQAAEAAEQAGDTAGAAHGREVLRNSVETIVRYGDEYEWGRGHLLDPGKRFPTADDFQKVRADLAKAIEELTSR